MNLSMRIGVSLGMGAMAATIFWGWIDPVNFIPGLIAGMFSILVIFTALHLTYVKGSSFMSSTLLEPGKHRAERSIALVTLGALGTASYVAWNSGNKPIAAWITVIFWAVILLFAITELRRRRSR